MTNPLLPIDEIRLEARIKAPCLSDAEEIFLHHELWKIEKVLRNVARRQRDVDDSNNGISVTFGTNNESCEVKGIQRTCD